MSPQSIYRQVAIGDLVLFGTLAVPGLGAWVLGLLLQANAALEWAGTLQPSAGVHLLLALVGALGMGFACLRLQAGATRASIRVTVFVKFWAAGLFVLGVMAGAPAIFLVVGVVDLVQGMLLLIGSRVRGEVLRSDEGMTI